MKFRIKCPGCSAKEKIIKPCRKCFRETCSECSIYGLCIDCFVAIEDIREVEAYWLDKYEMVTL